MSSKARDLVRYLASRIEEQIRRGATAKEIAEGVGLSTARISTLRRGSLGMRLDNVEAVARYLGMDLDVAMARAAEWVRGNVEVEPPADKYTHRQEALRILLDRGDPRPVVEYVRGLELLDYEPDPPLHRWLEIAERKRLQLRVPTVKMLTAPTVVESHEDLDTFLGPESAPVIAKPKESTVPVSGKRPSDRGGRRTPRRKKRTG